MKTKQKTAYKIVWKASPEGERELFNSLDFTHSLSLKYEMGKKTIPEIGKVFVFKKLEEAEKYLVKTLSGEKELFQYFAILEGQATSLTKTKVVCIFGGNYRHFWKNAIPETPGKYQMKPPAATYWCDSFTPLVEISLKDPGKKTEKISLAQELDK